MSISIKITLLASGIFLLTGLLTGVWKYAAITKSPEHRAPVYVDIAHRASLLYSFAALVIAKLLEFSPFSESVKLVATIAPLTFFALAIVSYIREGILNRTENQLVDQSLSLKLFMYALIIAEVGGVAVIFAGFIFTQFFTSGS